MFGRNHLKLTGKIKKMSFPSSEKAIIELVMGGAKFTLTSEDNAGESLIYARLLSGFYSDSKRKDRIIREDNIGSNTSARGTRSMTNRTVLVDAAFEIIFYDVP